MDQETLAKVLQKFPLPVSVVTVGRGGVENGLTVSWVCPVSFEPPQLVFAIDRLHYSVDMLRSSKIFAVNLLRGDQQHLAGHFARQATSSEEKLANLAQREGLTGAPILTEALAFLECEVKAIHEAGDHLMVVGEVVEAGVLNDGDPLSTAVGLRYVKRAHR
jgi:flavin reductase (DIM6/NTAB) family NADH-FMN oxidoreductase RutF